MSEENSGSSLGTFLGAFALGALAGAVVALLYAPQSGRETRELVAQKTREFTKKAGGVMDSAKQAMLQKRAEFRAAFEAGREAMHEEQSRLP